MSACFLLRWRGLPKILHTHKVLPDVLDAILLDDGVLVPLVGDAWKWHAFDRSIRRAYQADFSGIFIFMVADVAIPLDDASVGGTCLKKKAIETVCHKLKIVPIRDITLQCICNYGNNT